MRKTGLLILILPLLASCGVAHATSGEKHYQQPSAAMEPTIEQNASVTAETVKPGDYRPADGDIVVVRPPAGWGLSGPDDLLIRRVVGIPGETVECCDGTHGQLKRNGQWADEPYLSEHGATRSFKPVKVPPGELYLMEDYRGSGYDSAQQGTVSATSVIGLVKLG